MTKNILKKHIIKSEIPAERIIFARNFKKARKAAGLSQQKITELTGLAQSWISKVERGHSTINLDNMSILADTVNVPLWKLLHP